MAKNDDFTTSLKEDEAQILPPDFTLKKAIGEDVDLNVLFGGENQEKAQKVIDSHKSSFVGWVMKDMITLEEAYGRASVNLEKSEADVKKMARAAFVIKSQAGTFGFTLATHIAKSLDDFCTKHFKPTEQHMQVIRKHIDLLSLIFRTNLTGDGGQMGLDLSATLAKLVHKYT